MVFLSLIQIIWLFVFLTLSFLLSYRTAKIGIAAAGNQTETIGIDEYYPHPDYKDFSGEYDVMIVKLVSSSSAQWAAVNSDSSFPPVVPATEIDAVGIGFTSTDSGFASTVQHKPLIYIAPQACHALVQVSQAPPGQLFKQVPVDHMCLTDYSQADGQCTGDQGGPMVEMGNLTSADVIIGVMATYVQGLNFCCYHQCSVTHRLFFLELTEIRDPACRKLPCIQRKGHEQRQPILGSPQLFVHILSPLLVILVVRRG
jgi:hypothetical protein